MDHRIIGIDGKSPIYRVFRLWQLEEAMRLGCIWLTPPHAWDDPYEALVSRSAAQFDDAQVPLDGHLAQAFAQCWSATGDSDTLLRAYSFVVNDSRFGRNLYPGSEGVLVKSTPNKLLTALDASLPAGALGGSAFVGRVTYTTKDTIQQQVADTVDDFGVDAFMDPRRRAEILLLKRPSFSHENEVRLIYVEQRAVVQLDRVQIRFDDPNALFDGMWFDPRLGGLDLGDRLDMVRKQYGPRPVYQNFAGRLNLYETETLVIRLPKKAPPLDHLLTHASSGLHWRRVTLQAWGSSVRVRPRACGAAAGKARELDS